MKKVICFMLFAFALSTNVIFAENDNDKLNQSEMLNVRDHRNGVFVLNGGGYGYSAGTTAYTLALHQSVFQLMIDVLAAMRGDVDVAGIEFLQSLYGAEKSISTVSFQRRKYLKGESGSSARADNVHYLHFLPSLAIL